MGRCPHAAGDLVQMLASQTVFPAPQVPALPAALSQIANLGSCIFPMPQQPSLSSLTHKLHPQYCAPMISGQASESPWSVDHTLQQFVSPAAHPQVSPNGHPAGLHPSPAIESTERICKSQDVYALESR